MTQDACRRQVGSFLLSFVLVSLMSQASAFEDGNAKDDYSQEERIQKLKDWANSDIGGKALDKTAMGRAFKGGDMSTMMFLAMDKDKNGALDPSEFKIKSVSGDQDPRKGFARLDKDGDGSLSLEEASVFLSMIGKGKKSGVAAPDAVAGSPTPMRGIDNSRKTEAMGSDSSTSTTEAHDEL
eukprot:CAMPEP_0115850240 /NCGR_PEP_ID=MMETSP0287-20121206/11861_1 /TAXON_ID=412157 /ORGANISM="Chrysochromulina rotalis, Strain UIO044" /LENGTH=181 /DNA_ID=CAMNT_0003304229 /DNA_START=105 /DNA_END=650 /DNA_ORIENTATION=-